MPARQPASFLGMMDAGTLRIAPPVSILLLTEPIELRQMLTDCLAMHGYAIAAAAAEADLVILHAGAEHQPGPLAEQLAPWRAASKPVLVLCGESAPGFREGCLEIGASECLSMPFALEALLQGIQLCLSLPAQTHSF